MRGVRQSQKVVEHQSALGGKQMEMWGNIRTAMLLCKVNWGIAHLRAMYQQAQGEIIIQLQDNLLSWILERESRLTKHHFT